MYAALKDMKAFNGYLDRIREKRNEALEVLKSAKDMEIIFRNQGICKFADEVIDLIDLLILEEKEDEEEKNG